VVAHWTRRAYYIPPVFTTSIRIRTCRYSCIIMYASRNVSLSFASNHDVRRLKTDTGNTPQQPSMPEHTYNCSTTSVLQMSQVWVTHPLVDGSQRWRERPSRRLPTSYLASAASTDCALASPSSATRSLRDPHHTSSIVCYSMTLSENICSFSISKGSLTSLAEYDRRLCLQAKTVPSYCRAWLPNLWLQS